MRWLVKKNDRQLVENLTKNCKLTELQANLLLNRGIVSVEDANKYLYGDLSSLYNPLLIMDLEKGADIIVDAIKNKKKITIFGDYDADGITATATAMLALQDLGANVDFYLPHRLYEGYGMNSEAIYKIKEQGTDLIITVDNGIAAVNEIELAKKLGMMVVVTDHHNCPDILPEPDALINPKRPGDVYPNKNLCGCGLIWRVLEVVFTKMNANIDYIYDLLALVAVGTVADVMNLTDENRILVKEGLMATNANVNLGLSSLMKIFNLEEIKAEDIGFKIGPCLNADGRLYDAQQAVKLLITDNKEEAEEIAQYLYDVNSERKALTLECFEKAEAYIRDNGLENSRVMVVFENSIPEGLVGLVASKIKEKYQVPTFVFTEGEDYYKASGRGVEGHPLDLYSAIQKTRHLWEKGGGHKMACGISMKKDRNTLKTFAEELNKLADELLQSHPFVPTLNIDAEIDVPDEKLCREIGILEPTGKGNPKPLFVSNNVGVITAKPVGDGSHIAFEFTEDRKGIGFGKTYLYQSLNSPTRLKVVYSPVIDVFSWTNYKGEIETKRTVKMYIQDLQAVDIQNKSFLISSFKRSTQSAK